MQQLSTTASNGTNSCLTLSLVVAETAWRRARTASCRPRIVARALASSFSLTNQISSECAKADCDVVTMAYGRLAGRSGQAQLLPNRSFAYRAIAWHKHETVSGRRMRERPLVEKRCPQGSVARSPRAQCSRSAPVRKLASRYILHRSRSIKAAHRASRWTPSSQHWYKGMK